MIRSLKQSLLERVVFFLVIVLLASGAYSRNQVWSDEVGLWKDTVRKSPNKARPYGNLGLAYLNTGDYEKAFEMTRKAIQIDPKIAEAYYILGLVYQQWEKDEQAIQMGLKSLELDPTHYMSYYTLGALYFKNQQYEKAEEAYQKFIKVYPYYPEVHNLLAVVYAAQRRFDKVIEALEGELRINPLHPLAHLNLGQIYWFEFKNREKALYHLKIALMVDPFLPERTKIRKLVQKLEGPSSMKFIGERWVALCHPCC